MTTPRSILQTVKKVIEDLSEGVSELILTVVVLAEQNAEVPPGLPASATKVNETAAMLGNIARQLAKTNYKSFPEIANEINEACATVDGAVLVLGGAISKLKSMPDRKKGWNDLVDACRVMSGKTIRLLQIVYGADLKRLQLAVNYLRDELKNINSDLLNKDPKALADAASSAGTKIAQISNFLKQRAVEAESDLAMGKIQDDSEKIFNSAQQFIDSINEALADPDDVSKKNNLNKMVKDISDKLQNASNYATDVSPDASKIAKQGGGGLTLAAPVEAYAELRKSTFSQPDIMSPHTPLPLEDQFERTRGALADIETAAHKNPSQIAPKTQNAKKELDQLKNQAHKSIEDYKSRHPEENDTEIDNKYNDLINQIDHNFGEQSKIAKLLSQDPSPQNKKILEEKTKELKDNLMELENFSKNPVEDSGSKEPHKLSPSEKLALEQSPLHEDIETITDTIDDLLKAVKSGNVPSIAPISGKIKNQLDVMVPKAKKILENSKDSDKKKDIADVLNTLGPQGFAPLVQAVKASLENPNSPQGSQSIEDKAGAFKDILNDLENATEKSPLAENIENLYNLLDQIGDIDLPDDSLDSKNIDKARTGRGGTMGSNVKKNPSIQKLDAKKGKKEIVELIDEAQAVSDTIKGQVSSLAPMNKDKKERKAIKNDIEDIDDILNNMRVNLDSEQPNLDDIVADVSVAKKKLKNLDDNTHSVALADIDKLERTAEALENANTRNDPNALKREVDKLKNRGGQLSQDVKKLLDTLPEETEQKQKVHKAYDNVKRNMDDLMDAAAKGPKEDLKLDKFRDALDQLEDAIQNKADVEDPRDSEAKNDADELKSLIEQLPTKVKHDPVSLPNHQNKIKQKHKDLMDKSTAALQNSKDPFKSFLLKELLSEAEKIPVDLQTGENNYKKDVHSPAAKAQLQQAVDKSIAVIDDLIAAAKRPGLEDTAKALRDALDNAQAKATPAVKPQERTNFVDAIQKPLEQLRDITRHLANQNQDPVKKDNINSAVNALLDSCDTVKGDILDKSPKTALDPHCTDAKQNLSDLMDLLNPAALDDVDNIADNARALKHAVERGNKPTAQEISKELKKSIPNLASKVRNAEKDLDDDKKKKIEDAMDKLGKAVEQEALAAGSLLQKPNQPAMQKKLNDAVSDIEEATRAIEDALLNRDPTLDPKSQLYDDKDDESSISDLDDDPLPSVLGDDSLGGDDSIVPPPDDESPISRDIDRVKGTGNAIRAGAIKKNPQIVAAAAKKGEKEIFELAEKIRALAEETPDPKKQKTFEELNKKMQSALPTLLDTAKDFLENPNDEEAKKKLEKAEDNFTAAMDRAEKLTRQPNLQENAALLKKKLDELAAAHGRQDPSDMTDKIKDIRNLEGKMVHQAHYAKQEHNNPTDKQAITDAVKQFQKEVKGLTSVPTNIQKPPLDKHITDVKNATDKLLNATHSPALAKLDQFNLLLDDLRDFSDPSNLDLPAIQLAALDFLPVSEDLMASMDDLTKATKDPVQLKSLQVIAAELPYAVKNLLSPTKVLLSNPIDANAKKDLAVSIDDIGNLMGTLQATVHNKKAVPAEKKLLDIKAEPLHRIIPKMEIATKKLEDNIRDPRTKKKLIKFADVAGDKAEQINRTLIPVTSLPEKSEQKKRQIKLNAVDLVKAVEDGDENRFLRNLKTIQKTLPEYKELLKTDAEESHDIIKAHDIVESIKVAEKIIPEFKDISKAVFKDPTNLEKKNDFRNAVNRFNRAVDRAGNKVAPKQDEKAVRDAADDLRKKIAAIRSANKSKFDIGSKNEEPAPLRVLLRSAERRINQLPVQSYDDMEELKKLWKKFGVGAKIGVSEKELDEMQKNLESAVKKVAETTHAHSIAAVQDVEGVLDSILDITENHKPDKLKEVTAELTAKAHFLEDRTRNMGESHRQRYSSAFNKMNGPLKDILQRTEDSIRDPNNSEKKQKLKEAIDNIQVPLSEMKSIIDPESFDRQVELELVSAKASLSDMAEGARNRNPQTVQSTAQNTKQKLNTAINTVNNLIEQQPPNSQRRKNLQNAVEKLNSLATQLPPKDTSKAGVDHYNHRVHDAIDELLETVRSDIKDDILKTTAKVANKSTELTRDADKLTAKNVLDESKELTQDLKDIISGVDEHGEKMRATTFPTPLSTRIRRESQIKSPNDAKNISDEIQTLTLPSPPAGSTPKVSQLVSKIDSMAKPRQSKRVVPPPVEEKEPELFPRIRASRVKFEDMVEHVANQIARKGKDTQLKEATVLSSHLSELANASRAGSRQNVLVQGRNVSNSIREFCKELRAYASKIPKKNRHEFEVQDRLIRTAQGLENICTQLRILTSVKATSIESDKDTDLTLNTIIVGVGSAVTEGLSAIQITTRSILKS